MTSTTKLRVAVPDMADALEVVMAEVESATGFAAQPVFQEVDHSELVVELCLAGSRAPDPGRIAHAVEASANDLNVLSTWMEPLLRHDPAPVATETVFAVIDDPLPEVARRALRDGLPTSQWFPTTKDVGGGDRSYWMLAVLGNPSDGPPLVGVQRRRGYSYRFSAHEAASARIGLAS
jgi:hypothetical protein